MNLIEFLPDAPVQICQIMANMMLCIESYVDEPDSLKEIRLGRWVGCTNGG